jgi:hypothetical protein
MISSGTSQTIHANEADRRNLPRAETIISGLAHLLSAKVDAEQAYRNDGMTAAAAEAHTKPTDEYVRWRKLEACTISANSKSSYSRNLVRSRSGI